MVSRNDKDANAKLLVDLMADANRLQLEVSAVNKATATKAMELANEVRPIVSPEVERFYKGHNAAMLAWAKQHGNANFPIVEKDGKLYWVNRATRRKHEKSLKQQLREKKKNDI